MFLGLPDPDLLVKRGMDPDPLAGAGSAPKCQGTPTPEERTGTYCTWNDTRCTRQSDPHP